MAIDIMTNQASTNAASACPHCEGKGYVEIRDCTGEIQRSETCVFCNGTGILEALEED